jgi:hypothetical protein
MVRNIVACFAIAVAGVSSAALAQCPPNYYGQYLSSPSGTPVFAAVYRDSMCPMPYTCAWIVSWDLTTGQASCYGSTDCPTEVPAFVGDISLFTADKYALTGPASPNPVSFEAVLSVSQRPFSTGTLNASLKEGAQVASGNTNLVLPLSKSVGESFLLDMMLHVNPPCNAGIGAMSALSFVLPPGYGVTSCYGFNMPVPTAAARTSWGRLKTIYR